MADQDDSNYSVTWKEFCIKRLWGIWLENIYEMASKKLLKGVLDWSLIIDSYLNTKELEE